MRTIAWVACVLVACSEPEYVVPWYFDIAGPADSDLIDRTELLRVVGYGPTLMYERRRGPDGLDLRIHNADFIDGGTCGRFDTWVEAYDAAGAVIAKGLLVACNPPHGDYLGTVLIAPPNSITRAPARLSSARSDVAAYTGGGIVFAGGRGVAGDVSDLVDFYDPCMHSITSATLPVARAGIALTSHNGALWGFGGTGPDGAPTASLFRFTPPRDGVDASSMRYPDQTGFETTGQRAFVLSGSEVLITGDPALSLHLGDQLVTARPNTPPLSSRAAYVASESMVAVLGTGTLDLVSVFASQTKRVMLPPGFERAAVAATRDTVIVIGGAGRSALVISPTAGTIYKTVENALDVPRLDPTVVTTHHGGILVIGGVDAQGNPIASAELLNGWADFHFATIPMPPRLNPVAFPLPNGQVAIAGGDDPTDVIDMFTPDASAQGCINP